VGAGNRPFSPLLDAVLPGQTERLRLVPVLRELVLARVDVGEPVAVLDGIEAAGGIGAPIHELVAKIRLQLRHRLPGNAPDRVRIHLPDGLDSDAGPIQTRPFLEWARPVLAEHGSWCTVLGGSPQSLHLLETNVRAIDPLVAVLLPGEEL
jgi:hypothetical protein